MTVAPGKVLLETQDVRDLGAAPRIDRLVVVADAAQISPRLGKQLQPFVLALVGVLIFVDEQIAEAVAVPAQDVGVGAKDAQHVEQQVAKIAGVQGLQALLILRIELGAATGREGFGFSGVDLLGSPAAILPAVDEAGELTRGPALLVEAGGLDQLLQDAQLIVGVEDREVGVEADELGVAAQHARGDGMEGPEPRHALERSAGQSADALAHFAGGFIGEGDGEDLAWPGAASRDQMREPGGQRGGLAGAGASKNEDGPLGRQHGLALGRVEPLDIGRIGGHRRQFRHLGQVGGGERNGNLGGRFRAF